MPSRRNSNSPGLFARFRGISLIEVSMTALLLAICAALVIPAFHHVPDAERLVEGEQMRSEVKSVDLARDP